MDDGTTLISTDVHDIRYVYSRRKRNFIKKSVKTLGYMDFISYISYVIWLMIDDWEDALVNQRSLKNMVIV